MNTNAEKIHRLSAGLVLLLATHVVLAQTWTPTSAPTNFWQCIASSADGSKLAAGQYPGGVYISTNSGSTWTPTTATNGYWTSIAMSANGCKILATAAGDISGPGGVFTSTNSGVTWFTNNLPAAEWNSAASSADGNTLVVVTPFGGFVFSSTNGGINWTSNNLNYAVGVATSADGRKMFVAASLNSYRSTNSGTTWTPNTNAPTIDGIASPSQYIASSADGTRLALCVPDESDFQPAPIYVSTNSGDTWNPTSISNYWGFIMMSASGNTIMAMTAPTQAAGPIYVSTDCGNTWTTNGPIALWAAVASSADAGKLAAASSGDGNYDFMSGTIYVSQSVIAPQMAIAPANASVQLSWLVPSTNFVLQESPNLTSWTDTTNCPALNLDDLQDEVTIPPTNSAEFYRLKTP